MCCKLVKRLFYLKACSTKRVRGFMWLEFLVFSISAGWSGVHSAPQTRPESWNILCCRHTIVITPISEDVFQNGGCSSIKYRKLHCLETHVNHFASKKHGALSLNFVTITLYLTCDEQQNNNPFCIAIIVLPCIWSPVYELATKSSEI